MVRSKGLNQTSGIGGSSALSIVAMIVGCATVVVVASVVTVEVFSNAKTSSWCTRGFSALVGIVANCLGTRETSSFRASISNSARVVISIATGSILDINWDTSSSLASNSLALVLNWWTDLGDSRANSVGALIIHTAQITIVTASTLEWNSFT